MEKWKTFHQWWECKLVQPLWKTIWQFLKKVCIVLPYHSTTRFLGNYPREIKYIFPVKSCMWMFIAALFIVVHGTSLKNINWWMHRQIVIYPYQRILSSFKKEWTTNTCCVWMNLKNSILSEKSQTWEHTVDNSFILTAQESQVYRDINLIISFLWLGKNGD